MLKEDWLKYFLKYLTVERNYSPHTVVSYRKSIYQLYNYLLDNDLPLSRNSITEFLYHRRTEHKVLASSLNTTIEQYRHLARYLLREGLVSTDFMQDIQQLKEERRYPHILSPEEVVRLINAPVVYRCKRQRQMYSLIFRLLVLTGMRRQEIVDLNVSSFDWSTDTIRIWGKGSKERILPIPYELRRPLLDYFFHNSRWSTKPDGPAWVSSRGNRLSPDMIKIDVNKRATAAKIYSKRVYPHLLRHTVLTWAVKNTGDIARVSKYAGHSSINTTLNIYTHLLPDDLIEVQNALPWSKNNATHRTELRAAKSYRTPLGLDDSTNHFEDSNKINQLDRPLLGIISGDVDTRLHSRTRAKHPPSPP